MGSCGGAPDGTLKQRSAAVTLAMLSEDVGQDELIKTANRRRSRDKEEDLEARKQKRLINNRKAAARSRDRRRKYIEDLEHHIDEVRSIAEAQKKNTDILLGHTKNLEKVIENAGLGSLLRPDTVEEIELPERPRRPKPNGQANGKSPES